MSEAISHAEARHAEAGHHEVGFLRHYVFSTDHKMIGKQFLTLGLSMLVLGGILALLVRWELAWPAQNTKVCPEGCPVPGFGWVSSDSNLMPGGNILAPGYNAFFTMHATIMIFFAVMPILVGCFGNFLIPLMIGARDMAFPVLNMLSFWTSVPAGILMLASFWVSGGPAAAGWTSYVPLAADPQWTGVDWGQNLWCLSLIVLGVSSLMGSINYITTVVNMRAPGMTMFRMPLTIWSLFITAILLLLALPVLSSALGMLLFDRMAGTHFFNPAGGGEPLLWQHLFWFFGHPEVYILILPAMGIASDILAVFARKPIFGYHAMAFSMIAIAFLSWIVWGHHMFQSGMSPVLGTSFMMTTMIIAVPSAIKTFNWLGTLWGGSIRFTTPMLFALSFVSMFVIGGLSGIFMASTPVDVFIHDTYFIVAHIHYVVFGGSVMSIFAGIYYWFPKMFGKMMNETLGKIHWLLTLVFFNGTFFPMHIVGVGGHMRRIYDPTQYDFLAPVQHWNVFMTESALLLGAAQLIFVVNFFWSLAAGRRAERNPWQANTLEWEAPSPPGHGNFPGPLPTVYRGPYEYSSPLVAEDYLPQARRTEPAAASAAAH
ncbi:MAG TPA: cbb3-type cytochrome c oxidase subunit I [Candidatus Binatia bacterium]|jgi:cytochrome c oxidase subunit 1|nr:cbb3-type cytochrome c oxidase subunit I [Candidatus Binatia bacterium]